MINELFIRDMAYFILDGNLILIINQMNFAYLCHQFDHCEYRCEAELHHIHFHHLPEHSSNLSVNW